jgi:hypothetical protein
MRNLWRFFNRNGLAPNHLGDDVVVVLVPEQGRRREFTCQVEKGGLGHTPLVLLAGQELGLLGLVRHVRGQDLFAVNPHAAAERQQS